MNKKGVWAENSAKKYLIKKGYCFLEKNFYWRFGEIDLIFRDGHTYVFVEVRSKANSNYGFPEETITQGKINRIKKTARYYFKLNKINSPSCRFDFIGILGSPEKHFLKHIRNAWQ